MNDAHKFLRRHLTAKFPEFTWTLDDEINSFDGEIWYPPRFRLSIHIFLEDTNDDRSAIPGYYLKIWYDIIPSEYGRVYASESVFIKNLDELDNFIYEVLKETRIRFFAFTFRDLINALDERR